MGFNSYANREFSNFYYAPFELEGIVYQTVEHAFQAHKFTAYPEYFNIIVKCETPREAKKLGKTRHLKIRDDWENVKLDLMLTLVLAKFLQHPELLKLLKETGRCYLFENARWDNYWGIGKNGEGANKMGLILMVIREYR